MLNDKDENIYRSVVHPVPLINEYSLFFVAGNSNDVTSLAIEPAHFRPSLVPRLSPPHDDDEQ